MEVEGRTDNTTVVAGDNLCPSKTPRGPGDEETRSRWWHHTATDIDRPSPGLLHTLIQLLLNTRIHEWFCLCLGTRLMETQSALIGRTHAAGQVFTEFSMTSELKKTKPILNIIITIICNTQHDATTQPGTERVWGKKYNSTWQTKLYSMRVNLLDKVRCSGQFLHLCFLSRDEEN